MNSRIRKKFIGFLILCVFFNIVGILKPELISANTSIGTDNLIVNPGFEVIANNSNTAANWNHHGEGNFTIISSQVSGGSRAQRISISSLPMNQFTGVSQSIAVKSGQPYTMNGRFFVESISNAKVQLYADFFNAGAFVDSKVFDLSSQNTGQFVTLGGKGIVPDGATTVVIYALIRSTSDNGSGIFIADNLSLKYTNDSNLIANADYEKFSAASTNSEDWDYAASYNSAFSSVPYPSLSGARAQRISVSSLPVNGYVGVFQKIKVDSGKKFHTSGALLIESLSNAKAQLYIDFVNSAGHYLGTTIIEYAKPTNGTYMTLSDTGQIPKDTAFAVVYVMIRGTGLNGSGTIYADSLDFHYTNEANLFNNGDFEAQSAASLGNGWLPSYANDIHSYQLVSDNYGNTIQKIEASNIKVNEYVGISQLMKVVPNQKYTMSGRFKVDSISNAKVQLYADFFAETGVFLGANIVELPATTQGAYVTTSNTGIVPINAAYARIYAIIRAVGGSGAASIFVDDMRFSYTTNLLSNAGFEVNNFGSETPYNWTLHKQSGAGEVIQLVENTSIKAGVKNSYSASGRLLNQTYSKGTQTSNTLFKYDLNGNLTKKLTIMGTLQDDRVFAEQKSLEISGYWIPNNYFVGVSQDLRVIPDKSFNISGNININMLHQAKVQVYIDFYDIDGSFISSTIKDTTEANGKYTLLANQGIIPNKAVIATVYFLIRSTGDFGAGAVYLDSVSFNYN
ncbi:hypothetical protein KDC22_07295 [Paenibacillus tritici]|uniref:hypothetical protein n=1 Tax=Paenibacillus tritici TaxID=1873425 RepID=UPI001BA9363D|nr:hypothetical protein [Paenibacillus tritici]QUL56302.1 hypothetical protein KDC22_07295 [Paenibacillus tritici]